MKPSPHRQAWAKAALNIADRTLEFMGKETERPSTQDEMLPEYDFTGKKGVRGKHYQAYQRGYQVIIHKTDGTTEIGTSHFQRDPLSLPLMSAPIFQIQKASTEHCAHFYSMVT